jgi:DNA-binding NtrC family response regulator
MATQPPAAVAPEEGAAPAPTDAPGSNGKILCCPHCSFHFDAASALPFQKKGRNVLIVEDQDFFRNLIRESLGDGYNYLMAASVEQAQSILGSVDVDLVMLDLTLQEPYDGEQVLDSAGGKVPILVLTGDQDPDLYGEKWNDYQARGATDLIIKGLTIREQIAIKVNAILNEDQAPWTG